MAGGSNNDGFDVAIKSNDEIDKMKAPELKQYAKQLSKNFRDLNSYLFNQTDGIITKMKEQQQQVLQQLEVSRAINQGLLRQLSDVERSSISNAQYVRRETLELQGIPESFDADGGLEGKVIALLNDIAPAADIVETDVQAVHRLSKKDIVIVKLISRKKKQELITKRAKLKEDAIRRRHGITGGVWLNESMCPQIRKLHYHCRKLKKQGTLTYYNFFNGNLRVQMREGGDKHLVGHISDLVKLTGMSKEDIENIN